MFFETKEKAIEAIVNALPYPQHISDWDLSIENEIRFTWRKDNRFRLDLQSGRVEEVGDGVLIGSDISILVTKLLKGVAF